MFSEDADLFFFPPCIEVAPPNWFGVLYLLRRDIDLCMGIDPTTGQPVDYRAEWPGAMTIMAGIDLLAKFYAGSDTGKVGDRFYSFLNQCFARLTPADRKVIYQLRNSLLHSFGLYSKDNKGKVYRFFLTGHGSGPLVSFSPPEQYNVDLRVLHREFERAVADYQAKLEADTKLQNGLAAMFGNYGRIYIG
jgi:hypothetical protein